MALRNLQKRRKKNKRLKMETSELKKIAADLRSCIDESTTIDKQASVEEAVAIEMDEEKTKEFMKLAHAQGFTFEQVVKFLKKSEE